MATAKEILNEQREERAKGMAEAVKRMDSSKPTPTQDENDLARLGAHVDEKEDDGSGPNVIVTPDVHAGLPHGAPKPKAQKREW